MQEISALRRRGCGWQSDQGSSDAVGGVAEDVAFGGEVAGDGLDAECFDAVDVGDGDLGALGGVAARGIPGETGAVLRGRSRRWGGRRAEDALDVLGGGEVEALVGLGHEVADEDAGGRGGARASGMPLTSRLVMMRGVERAGADGDEVGGGDGGKGFRRGRRVGRLEHELDDALAAGGDVGFAADEGAVFHARGEGDVEAVAG